VSARYESPLARAGSAVVLVWTAALRGNQIGQRSRRGSANRRPELTPQTDELILTRFGPLIESAAAGELSGLGVEPAPSPRPDPVARSVPAQRPPRHARRFAQDHKALSLAISGMQFGADAVLDPLERIFFYMPLMHAESLDVQDDRSPLFRRLFEEAPAECESILTARCRRPSSIATLIARFGRFPYRNATLGRSSSAAELEWLESEGDHFGQ